VRHLLAALAVGSLAASIPESVAPVPVKPSAGVKLQTSTPTQSRLEGNGGRRSLPGRKYRRFGSPPPPPNRPDPCPDDAEGRELWERRQAKKKRQADALLRSQGVKP
jgi:hypothetical protein